jgi:hypothetical protein
MYQRRKAINGGILGILVVVCFEFIELIRFWLWWFFFAGLNVAIFVGYFPGFIGDGS